VAESLKAYRAEPYSYSEARALSAELGLSEPVAVTLVRRGYRTPEQARRFLAADECHDPDRFDTMAAATEAILAAVREGRRITVHGDFDVDGVCATAIAVGTLRDLGADCDWLIPDRLGDGYGLSRGSVERMRDRGTSLILTVDCGITATAEVALAREAGMEVIVTDHHQPQDELPVCTIVHPGLGGYPCPELCGTAVAWKLCQALRRRAGASTEEDRDLDLVALATVADVVPLLGENRNLVRRGLDTVRRSRRPGLRALIAAARCEPTRLDESDLAFRLAPRINAAGRLYRADAGVELFLTEDSGRAEQIAAELDRANQERRFTEREVEAAAEAARGELSAEMREVPALVLAGPGWHPGVVGIVASRLAERHFRPVVLLSLDGDGGARGSGRSIPGFDLLAGLEACAEHLERFGGHRAAAGLELRAESIEAFREAFVAHAASVLGPEDLLHTERIDAMVGGAGIGLELAEELERLAPFGMGNPGVRLLVPSARVRDVRPMGEGRHSRFSLHSGAHRALAVAFGRSTIAVGEEDQVDAAVRLEVNQWNGSVEPRLILRDLYPVEAAPEAGEQDAHGCECGAGEWWERFDAELCRDHDDRPSPPDAGRGEREAVRHSGSPAAVLAELVSSGERVLALCADAGRRAELAAGAAGLARFGAAAGSVACGRCGGAAAAALARGDGLALADYQVLAAEPRLAEGFDHVVLVDPPHDEVAERLARGVALGGGFLHPCWGDAEHRFALSVLEEQLGLRGPLRSLYLDLRGAPNHGDEELRARLRGSARHSRSPELAARAVRVLGELGIVHYERSSGVSSLRVVSSTAKKLEGSESFRAYRARYEEGERYLERRRQP
jgi:single-stranded-DNA-specific exonuclease